MDLLYILYVIVVRDLSTYFTSNCVISWRASLGMGLSKVFPLCIWLTGLSERLVYPGEASVSL